MKIEKKWIFSIIAIIVIFYFLLRQVDLLQMSVLLKSTKISYILLGLMIVVITLILKTYKWHLLAKPFIPKLTDFDSLSSFAASTFIGNITPARAGDFTRPLFLKKKYDISYSKMLPAVIVEKVIDLIVLLFYSVIFFIVFSKSFSGFMNTAMIIMAVLTAVLIIILFNKNMTINFGKWFFKKLSFIKPVKKVELTLIEKLEKFYVGFAELKKSNYIVVILTIFFIWFLEGMLLYFAAYALNQHISLLICVGLTSIAIIVGTASSLPGGLGPMEVVLFGFLVLLGFNESLSMSIALLYRFFYISGVIMCSPFFFLETIKKKIIKK